MENYKIEDYPCISDDTSVLPKNTIWLPTIVLSVFTKICMLTGFIAWPLFIFPTLPMVLASLFSLGFTHYTLKSTQSFQKVTRFFFSSSSTPMPPKIIQLTLTSSYFYTNTFWSEFRRPWPLLSLPSWPPSLSSSLSHLPLSSFMF